MPTFERYIGIDYSGAQTCSRRVRGLKVFAAYASESPHLVAPPDSARNWSRSTLAYWLAAELAHGGPTIVGIDHAFSFPERYFRDQSIDLSWDPFLDHVTSKWPTNVSPMKGILIPNNGSVGQGYSRLKRRTELRAGTAKSVFHFGVPGQVACSSHAGIPWLRFIRSALRDAAERVLRAVGSRAECDIAR